MRLDTDQRRRLIKGDYRPLLFAQLPIAGPCCTVLTWSRELRHHDGSGGAIVVPRQPLRWIEVTSIKRHRKGGWQVRYDVRDLRQEHRYLRATPPVWDPHGTTTSDPSVDADKSSYTASRWRSIDDLEAVPRKFQERVSKAASERDHTRRLERVAAARVEGWRFKRERQRAIERFRPAG